MFWSKAICLGASSQGPRRAVFQRLCGRGFGSAVRNCVRAGAGLSFLLKAGLQSRRASQAFWQTESLTRSVGSAFAGKLLPALVDIPWGSPPCTGRQPLLLYFRFGTYRELIICSLHHTGNLDVSILGQLTPTHLSLGGSLEACSLQVVRFNAREWGYRVAGAGTGAEGSSLRSGIRQFQRRTHSTACRSAFHWASSGNVKNIGAFGRDLRQGFPVAFWSAQDKKLLAEKCHLGFASRMRSEQSDEQSA
jgi:hypothetical protein